MLPCVKEVIEILATLVLELPGDVVKPDTKQGEITFCTLMLVLPVQLNALA